jgi:hypothetical protein
MITKTKKVAKQKLTAKEKAGVKAIIFLQDMVGIKEPADVALRNWREFSDSMKFTTMNTYKIMSKKD